MLANEKVANYFYITVVELKDFGISLKLGFGKRPFLNHFEKS